MDEAQTVLELASTELDMQTVVWAYNINSLIVFIDIDYTRSFQFNGV